jgi:hypothetical protein
MFRQDSEVEVEREPPAGEIDDPRAGDGSVAFMERCLVHVASPEKSEVIIPGSGAKKRQDRGAFAIKKDRLRRAGV